MKWETFDKFRAYIGILVLTIMMCSGTLAQSESFGTYKQNQVVNLIQTYNATACNITSITLPNSTIIDGTLMTKNGIRFNYTFTQTDLLGNYYVCGDCDTVAWCADFQITASGNERINSGEGISFFISVIVIFVVAGLFLIIGAKMESPLLKVIFIGMASMMLVITVLYSMVALTQFVANYAAIVEGFGTFWFVVKILIGVGIIALLVFSIIATYGYWMKKRGFRD